MEKRNGELRVDDALNASARFWNITESAAAILKVGILGTLQIELVPTAILRNLTPQLQKIPASISELFMSKPNNSFYSQRDSFYLQRGKPMKTR